MKKSCWNCIKYNCDHADHKFCELGLKVYSCFGESFCDNWE